VNRNGISDVGILLMNVPYAVPLKLLIAGHKPFSSFMFEFI
jgi:hypothetical protein